MDNKEIKEEIINEEEPKDGAQEKATELENEVFTYTVDNNNINNDYNKNSYNDKKSIIYIIIGALILIIIIIILVVFANKKTSKISKFTDIENAMVKGAKTYYEKNSDKLPISNSVEITTDTLIQNSFMKPFSEMVPENTTCTGHVTVTKSEEEYTYLPYLDCGESYKSLTLAKKITENTVTTGDGLYNDNGEYIFRGEYPKNYVSFDNKMWRIISVNNDLSIKMMLIDAKFERNVWDDRYNSSKDDYSGINDFKVSRLLEYLTNLYKDNTLITKNNKNLLVKHDWCIGKIGEDNMPINEMNLCSETYNDLYIGVVEADEVLKASIATNCVNMYDNECTNYNYFLNINTGWTMNASSDKTYNVFTSNGGTISYKKASNPSYIRPVININANVLYKDGDGTKDNPYKFENK
ncbi:MAG: hypothetical protein J6B64_01515 [Bacilli bacterium]|nr:hypothetical protein [Bacilli bacterium]MBP3920768.1 hypothetical protein [Bacilli bacterium]